MPMSQEVKHYQVLHRKNVEYSYLVIVYKDLLAKPMTPPTSFYAFRDKNGSGIRKKDHAPKAVRNIHGTDVYKNYLTHGWQDITNAKDLYPWAIKTWLKQVTGKEV